MLALFFPRISLKNIATILQISILLLHLLLISKKNLSYYPMPLYFDAYVKSYRVNYHKSYVINDHNINDYDLILSRSRFIKKISVQIFSKRYYKYKITQHSNSSSSSYFL